MSNSRDLVFIEMADKAEEIQQLKSFLDRGDYWCWASDKSRVFICRDRTPRLSTKDDRNKKIWLPTHPQLYGILGSFGASGVYEILRQQTEFQMILAFQSFEQTLFAFVMQKIFHKVWDGRCWMIGEVK